MSGGGAVPRAARVRFKPHAAAVLERDTHFDSTVELFYFKVHLIVQVASIMIGRERKMLENSHRELTCFFFCRNTVKALVEI